MTTEPTVPVPSGETAPNRSSDEIVLSETGRSRSYTFLHSGQASARALKLTHFGGHL